MQKDDFRFQAILQELVRRANETNRRMRSIEQRIEAMEIKQTSQDQSMLERTQKLNGKLKEIEVTVESLKDEMLRFKNNLDKINKQMPDLARKRDIKEIERMFELLNPIRREFLTRDELEEELKSKV